MKNAKHVVAVMVVATALCADRPAEAAPSSSRPVAVRDLARQLATRLTVNLRQVIPATRIEYPAQLAFSRPCDVRPVDAGLFVAHPWSLSPFQFRLPPPVKA